MTQSIDELIEQVKEATPIEDVISEDPGFSIIGHGRYLTTQAHDSLVIDTYNRTYYWNSQNESGDVIQWIMKRRGWDFKSAIEYLCKRAGTAAPEWGAGSPQQRMAARARQDVFETVVQLCSTWLYAEDDALEYVHSRGWSDETIRRAQLGYTGNNEEYKSKTKELLDAISLTGGDPQSPAGVAVLGYRGNVRSWMMDHEIQADKDWLEKDYIPGIIGKDMLIYPHMVSGRVHYLSLRGIHEKRHYNLPVALVGERQIYRNWEWSSQSTQCIVVEGQADAITLAQWGLPAVALCGVHADEHLVRMLGGGDEKKSIDFYLGLDSDAAGEINRNKVAALFGPMVRLVTWKGIGGITTFIDPASGEEREVKDANDLLRGMQR
jgi:hypothetical protein